MTTRPDETCDLICIVDAQHGELNLSVDHGKEVGDIAASAGGMDFDVGIATAPQLHPLLYLLRGYLADIASPKASANTGTCRRRASSIACWTTMSLSAESSTATAIHDLPDTCWLRWLRMIATEHCAASASCVAVEPKNSFAMRPIPVEPMQISAAPGEFATS